MRKGILSVVCLLFLVGWAQAQVIATFEAGDEGFTDLAWASPNGLTGLSVVTDPNLAGNHVLQATFDRSAGQRATISFSPKATMAQVVMFYIWLPTDTPDSLQIETFAQDNSHWSHTEGGWIYAKDIPKGVWCPLNFYIKQGQIKNANFNVENNNFGRCGIDIADWSTNGIGSWTGNILIDNVSLLGVKPIVVSNFETDITGWSVNSWGGAVVTIERATSPAVGAGSLQINYPPVNTGNPRDDIVKSGVGPTSSQELVYWVYVPADAPDSLGIQIMCQDNNHWKHNIEQFYAKDIPKEVWYPLYFSLKKHSLTTDPNLIFDPVNYGFGVFGMEVGSWSLHDADLTWNGHVWVDNVNFLNDVIESKWLICDFETPAQPTDLFVIPTSGAPASIALSNITDPTNDKNHALNDSLDFAMGDTAAIQKNNILIYNSNTSTWATRITMNFFAPDDIPLGALVSIALKGAATGDVLLEGNQYLLDTLGTNSWKTIAFDVDSAWVTSGDLNPQLLTSVIVRIIYASAQTWKGNVYFDNVTLIGIETPPQTVVSPITVAEVKLSENTVGITPFEYVRFDWVDNLNGKETYNVYVSTNGQPISTLLRNVKKIAADIPHGQKKWGYRPYSTNGAQQSLYFIVTANDGARETSLRNESKVGPIAINTSVTPKVKYVADFASSFTLDGNISEFEPYAANKITPEFPCAGARASAWTDTSTDFNYGVTLVIDDSYLYIGADVIDDDVNTAVDEQTWAGDALEFFIGAYDIRTIKALHSKNSPTSQGDWRIGITSLGQFGNGGPGGITIPGGQSIAVIGTGGYKIEARLTLDSLAIAGKFGKVNNGALLPFKIDANDNDPNKGDGTGRGFMLEVGGWGAVGGGLIESDYLRPSTSGLLEVIDSPNDVAEVSTLPKEFALYNNYPNPFNPTSKIKYDLPKDVKVTLKVYDILGREVATLVNKNQSAGSYEINFDAAKLATGVYIYRIKAGDFVQTRKMMLLK